MVVGIQADGMAGSAGSGPFFGCRLHHAGIDLTAMFSRGAVGVDGGKYPHRVRGAEGVPEGRHPAQIPHEGFSMKGRHSQTILGKGAQIREVAYMREPGGVLPLGFITRPGDGKGRGNMLLGKRDQFQHRSLLSCT